MARPKNPDPPGDAPPLASVGPPQVSPDCALCPRLSLFRQANQKKFPAFYNAPVPSLGPLDAALLVVGLAPGLKGANRTGFPFTGDDAGDLLFPTLLRHGFAQGHYRSGVQEHLTLSRCRITNTVRCVPPKNRPLAQEVNTCQRFLRQEINAMNRLVVIVALGRIAHQSLVCLFGHKHADVPFRHGQCFSLTSSLTLIDSYHCSRYNTNTKRLTPSMFHDVFAKARQRIAAI